MGDGFFSPNNILFRILSRFCDIFFLHFLWLVCSIPIFTIGASTTALHYTTMKSVTVEDGYIAKRFFKSFKENFKQSTLIWLIMLGAGLILAADMYISVYLKLKPLMMIFTILLGLYLFILIYVFPLQAKFDNKISVTIRNAFLLSIRYFPWTLLLVLVHLLIAYLWYLSPLFTIAMILCGSSAYAYPAAFLFNKLFKPFIPEAATGSSDEDFRLKDGTDEKDNAKDSDNSDDTDCSDNISEANPDVAEDEDVENSNSKTNTKKSSPRKLSMAEKVNSVSSYVEDEEDEKNKEEKDK